ncbi:hypothetical protein NVP1256O_04 [Vibrio phage 1.256.O._10N.286.45.F8]|nr:hypothetical protein NVP1256O_04 [Vibrio phage 1.256.O._10N.286.45.F8]
MKSKYAELFTAKLNDMDLVLFEKHKDWDEWALTGDSDRYFMVSDNFEYFLCLPQHKEACLHWLNGGDAEFHLYGDSWGKYSSFKGRWDDESDFIDEDVIIRIKTNS